MELTGNLYGENHSWYNITGQVAYLGKLHELYISVTLIIFYPSLQSVRGQFFCCSFHVVVSVVSKNCHFNFFLYNFHLQDFIFWGARLVQWWGHSPPTNVSQVQIPALTWIMTLLLVFSDLFFWEVFLRVFWLVFPLRKNQHFQISIPSGTHGHF